MLGLYIQSSIASAILGKKAPYPKKPFEVVQNKQEMSKESAEIAAQKFDAWTKLFNQNFVDVN